MGREAVSRGPRRPAGALGCGGLVRAVGSPLLAAACGSGRGGEAWLPRTWAARVVRTLGFVFALLEAEAAEGHFAGSPRGRAGGPSASAEPSLRSLQTAAVHPGWASAALSPGSPSVLSGRSQHRASFALFLPVLSKRESGRILPVPGAGGRHWPTASGDPESPGVCGEQADAVWVTREGDPSPLSWCRFYR